MYYFIVVRESERFYFLKTISFFCTFILNSFFFTNHNQCKKDLRKSGGSKEKDIHSYYAMVWASLAAKKQQQKLEIEKKGGVYGDFSLFDKNRKFPRYLLSAKSFDQKMLQAG